MYAWILSIQACIGMILEGMDLYRVNVFSEQYGRKEYAFKYKCTENASVT